MLDGALFSFLMHFQRTATTQWVLLLRDSYVGIDVRLFPMAFAGWMDLYTF